MTKFDETQNTLLRFVIQGCKIGVDIANAAREVTTLRRPYSGGVISMSSKSKSTAHPAHPSTREQRGLALYRERGDEIKHVRRSVWSVPSCTRSGVYLVDLADGICTCPDMPPAGEVCKHATAATVARAKTAECAGCGGRSRRRDMVEVLEEDHLTFFEGDQLCRTCADNAGVAY
jgi:hypothetical protein